MNILIELFLMFAKLSVFSFGGGYVMFPMLMSELESNKIATVAQMTEVIAIAGMSPGPVAVNAAVGLGYKVAGFPGVFAAFLGIALPCAIIVILVASFFFKVYKHPVVRSILNVLGPVITGIIFYAAVGIALKNGIVFAGQDSVIEGGWNVYASGRQLFEVKSILIAAGAFFLLVKTKVHPIFIIVGSGILGAILF